MGKAREAPASSRSRASRSLLSEVSSRISLLSLARLTYDEGRYSASALQSKRLVEVLGEKVVCALEPAHLCCVAVHARDEVEAAARNVPSPDISS